MNLEQVKAALAAGRTVRMLIDGERSNWVVNDVEEARDRYWIALPDGHVAFARWSDKRLSYVEEVSGE